MVAVLLADGLEEIEALAPVDILRRGGVEVKTYGVSGREVKGAHGITLLADAPLEELPEAGDTEMVVLPGGMPGAQTLHDDSGVRHFVQEVYDAGNYVAAICAAPIVLGSLGILKGRDAISYPGYESELTGANIVRKPVVISDKVITANGPGAAFRFSYELLKILKAEDTARRVLDSMQLPAAEYEG